MFGFLPMLCSIWIICFSCLLGPTALCAMNTFVLFSFIRTSWYNAKSSDIDSKNGIWSWYSERWGNLMPICTQNCIRRNSFSLIVVFDIQVIWILFFCLYFFFLFQITDHDGRLLGLFLPQVYEVRFLAHSGELYILNEAKHQGNLIGGNFSLYYYHCKGIFDFFGKYDDVNGTYF